MDLPGKGLNSFKANQTFVRSGRR